MPLLKRIDSVLHGYCVYFTNVLYGKMACSGSWVLLPEINTALQTSISSAGELVRGDFV
jgi:hypothetical protein